MLSSLRLALELQRGEPGRQLRALPGLRGFAVLLVFLVHFTSLARPWVPEGGLAMLLNETGFRIGASGVELFFLLSGYLVYGSLMRRPQAFWPYIRRRLVRIYPAFLAVLALYLALFWALPARSKLPADAGQAAVYLVQNLLLLPGVFAIYPIISVAWSLSYELFFYLGLPLLMALAGLRHRLPGQRLALLALLAVAVMGAAVLVDEAIRFARFGMFFAGMALFDLMQLGRASFRPPTPWLALGLALLAGLIPAGEDAWELARVSLLAAGFGLVCRHCFEHPASRLAAWFDATPLRWLGNISYSYYLLHGLALQAGFGALAAALPVGTLPAWALPALLGPMFLLTVAAALPLYLWVERPFSLAARPP